MTRLFTFFVLLFAFTTLNAQKTYVKITKDNHVSYYPPGTQFELKNPHGYIILKYSETPRVQEIDGEYKLILSPNWKKGKEVIKLSKGDKVELALTSSFGSTEDQQNILLNTLGIKVQKEVTDSKKYKGKKNLRLELDNGILFVYEDGEYYAKLDNKYIDIRNKYVIKTKKGTLRVSFNPNTGKVWWVFEG